MLVSPPWKVTVPGLSPVSRSSSAGGNVLALDKKGIWVYEEMSGPSLTFFHLCQQEWLPAGLVYYHLKESLYLQSILISWKLLKYLNF